MYGQRQDNVTQVADGQNAQARLTANRELIVTLAGSGAAGVPAGPVISVQEVGTQAANIAAIKVAAESTAPVNTNATGTTAGTTTKKHFVTAASNNATSLKPSPSQLYSYDFGNKSATAFYVKFYDLAATPTPASDTVVWSVFVPAGGRAVGEFPRGLPFTTGLAYAVVAGIADTDNTSVGSGDGTLNMEYI